MKILHVSPSYFPATKLGGPIQSVYLLNKTLVDQGMAVDVFTTNAGLEDSHQTEEWQWLDGVRIRYFPYYGYIHYNFSPALWKALVREVINYDLVHITAVWNFPVLAAALACQKYKIPYIISPRGTIYPETVALKSAYFKKIYYALFAKRCLTHASAIHFTADDEQQKVVPYLGLTNQTFVIPNGINLADFEVKERLPPFSSFHPSIGNQPYVLFLGRISRKKGLDLLIPAFAALSGAFPQYNLIIAGPDQEGYRFSVEKLIREAGIGNKVIFTGMLEEKAKLAAYRDAAFFVLPSYSENFGMSVVEAMACGTPVVISDQVGIAPEILIAQAGIVTQASVESVKAGIYELLNNPQKRRDLADKGRRMVAEYYGIKKIAETFINRYQQILTNGPI